MKKEPRIITRKKGQRITTQTGINQLTNKTFSKTSTKNSMPLSLNLTQSRRTNPKSSATIVD
jgi:hypothetical protein